MRTVSETRDVRYALLTRVVLGFIGTIYKNFLGGVPLKLGASNSTIYGTPKYYVCIECVSVARFNFLLLLINDS